MKEINIKLCHDCGVREGEIHRFGCNIELCPFCFNQLITCYCRNEHFDIVGLSRDLDEDQKNKRWLIILENEGRIPYYQKRRKEKA